MDTRCRTFSSTLLASNCVASDEPEKNSKEINEQSEIKKNEIANISFDKDTLVSEPSTLIEILDNWSKTCQETTAVMINDDAQKKKEKKSDTLSVSSVKKADTTEKNLKVTDESNLEAVHMQVPEGSHSGEGLPNKIESINGNLMICESMQNEKEDDFFSFFF